MNTRITALALSLLLLPGLSQAVEPLEKVADFQIMRVKSSEVCFGVYNSTSREDKKVTYATFQTESGDRWQVVGFVDDELITEKGDLLTIRFDEEQMVVRGVEFSKGDFALPFVDEKELALFDNFVASKQTMELKLQKVDDSITVPLANLREAGKAIDECLKAMG